MSENQIHPSAIVEEGAQLGARVVIEPYAIVKKNVILEDDVVIKSHAYIDGHTRIGQRSVVFPYASIGTVTQDLKYKGETTYVHIGQDCQIREFVTINSSCGEGTEVRIGHHCLIMAYCHVAHNCSIGDRVIMANNVALAGHVVVGDYVVIGGMTPVAQFVHIGAHAMVGGMSRIAQDIPPFTIGGGDPYKMGGINLVGLKRRNFSLTDRNLLAKAFNLTYRGSLGLEESLERILAELEPTPYILQWVDFCKNSKKGLIGFADRQLRKDSAIAEGSVQ